MAAGFLQIPNRKLNDTFNSFPLQYFDRNLDPISLVGADVVVQYRRGCKTGPVAAQFAIGTGLIFEDDLLGKIRQNEFICNWGVDTFFFEFKITFVNGVVKRWVEGEVIVEQNTTFNT